MFNPNEIINVEAILPFYHCAASFNHKFGKSIDKCNTQVVMKYYIIQLLKKILVYSDRISAEESLESPIFLQYKLNFYSKSIPILQEKML